jgi:hypothetical protein
LRAQLRIQRRTRVDPAGDLGCERNHHGRELVLVCGPLQQLGVLKRHPLVQLILGVQRPPLQGCDALGRGERQSDRLDVALLPARLEQLDEPPLRIAPAKGGPHVVSPIQHLVPRRLKRSPYGISPGRELEQRSRDPSGHCRRHEEQQLQLP